MADSAANKLKGAREIRGLLCHAHVAMAMRCYGSLLRYSQEPVSLVIHDDGSLTAEDCDLIHRQLWRAASCRIVSREEGNEMAASALSNLPFCRDFRSRNVLGLKLFDIVCDTKSEDVAYVDSDVAFFRPFTGLFSFQDSNSSAVFMQDVYDSYSLRPWHLMWPEVPKLVRNLNSGLLFIKKDAVDFEFIEHILSRNRMQERFAKVPHLAEQTCWAALAQRAGCSLWSRESVAVMPHDNRITLQNMVAVHFTGLIRNRMPEDLAAAGMNTDSQAVTPLQVRAKTLGFASFMHSKLKARYESLLRTIS